MMASPSSMVFAGALCFIASSISSVGGMGGGGLFIPILSIVSGFDLKEASSFSAFMVTGGSLANVVCNLFARNEKRTLIDYDIALLSEPCMLLGVAIGVICNLSFPQWLITLLFSIFLSWSTWKTCKNGILLWKRESQETDRALSQPGLEDGFDEAVSGIANYKEAEEPLLLKETNTATERVPYPWKKLGSLILIWLSFYCLHLLRGSGHGAGIIFVERCGAVYWILLLLQIPLAGLFTTWMIMEIKNSHQHTPNHQSSEAEETTGRAINYATFPFMALLAGVLGGVFGIGGGLLISPLLLQLGIPPEVASATCSFMVFFSSTMSVFQYIMLGMEKVEIAVQFAILCFVGSLLGFQVIKRAIHVYGRASLIVFTVGIVMLLSTILMTSFEVIEIWGDFSSSKEMGFKTIC